MLYEIHILSKFQLHSYFWAFLCHFSIFFRFLAKRPGTPRAQKGGKYFFKKAPLKSFFNVLNYLVTKIQVDQSKIGRDILRTRAQ